MSRLFKCDPHLYKHRDRYNAIFTDPETGARKWVSLGTRYQEVAEKRFRNLVIEYEAGAYDPFKDSRYDHNAILLLEAVDRFNAFNQTRVDDGRLSPETATDYRNFLRMLVAVAPADLLLRNVDEELLRLFIFRPPSEHTRRGYYIRTNRFLRWCIENRHLRRNPLDDIDKPAPGKKTPAFLSRHDVDRLLQAIESDYRYKLAIGEIQEGDLIWVCDVFRLAVATGLRLSELTRLRWIDVDLRHGRSGFLYVRSGIERKGRRARTKNRHDRTIPLSPLARQVLERLDNARRNENPREPVFAGPNGEPRYGPWISRQFRAYRDVAGLPAEYHFHTLRHTFASWLRLSGVGLDRIKEWMGHATIEQTLVYAHITPAEIAREIEIAFPAEG